MGIENSRPVLIVSDIGTPVDDDNALSNDGTGDNRDSVHARDSVYVNPSYNTQLRNTIQDIFVENIRVHNVIHVFHKYNPKVLTEEDKEQITITLGEREKSRKLLHCLVTYENWFNCLLNVLEDNNVKQNHLAVAFRNKKKDLDDQLLETEFENDGSVEVPEEQRESYSLTKENQRLRIKLEKSQHLQAQEKMLRKECEEQMNKLKNEQAAINKIRMEAKDDLESQLKKVEIKQNLEMEHQAKLEAMRNDEKIAMEARNVEVKSLTRRLECLSKKYKDVEKANEQAEARLKERETDHTDEIKSKTEQIENLKLALSAIKEMYDQYKVKMKNLQMETEENAELYNSNIARLKEEIECFKINYYKELNLRRQIQEQILDFKK
ncbi:unnamed protein product [Lymnaea stagnalis]|uniref:Uncharacterized protein n=1 Tax=Lymnaea stagnalis TaxID=6523 RepID=A0AAV2HKY4_LYMST